MPFRHECRVVVTSAMPLCVPSRRVVIVPSCRVVVERDVVELVIVKQVERVVIKRVVVEQVELVVVK